jgi:hypothetical protein
MFYRITLGVAQATPGLRHLVPTCPRRIKILLKKYNKQMAKSRQFSKIVQNIAIVNDLSYLGGMLTYCQNIYKCTIIGQIWAPCIGSPII